MNRVYILVGHLIKQFQLFEELLCVIPTSYNYNSKFQDNAILSVLTNISKQKLYNKIKNLKNIFVPYDILVLNYIRTKRNYLVHSFFIENKFNNEIEINYRIEELTELSLELDIVLKATKNYIKTRKDNL